MKILICNYEYPPIGGGGGVTTQKLAEELATRHTVTVITSGFGLECGRSEERGVIVYRVPVFRRARTAGLFSMLLYVPLCVMFGLWIGRDDRFDVIHSHFAIPTGPGSLLLAKLLGIPHVLSIHGGDIYDPSKKLSPHKAGWLNHVVESILRGSDRVLAQSSNTLHNAMKYYDVQRPPDVIPHAIETPRFQRISRHEASLDENAFILITVGRLIPRKGLHELLDAIAELHDQNVQLLVLGEGPEMDTIRERASALNLEKQVTLKGWVSDEQKYQLLDLSDVYVSTAEHEGFGLVFLEAMACGLPIVSYDNGGHTDFLVDQQSGHLIKLGDVPTFAKKLAALRDDPAACTRMSGFNLAIVRDYYIGACARKHERVFEEVVNASA